MADDDKTLPTTKSSQSDVDAFLRKVAATPNLRQSGRRGRLMFAMDATASRQPSWDRACQIQAEMFEATAALGGLDVQLVFYRGFRQCQASPWVGNAKDLLKRMTSVTCLGGQTQIDRVLNHALKESRREKVDAVVFVGDCMEEEVDRLCHHAGELGLLGVPVFMFHEGGEPIARRAFEQIARLSGGAYCPFDASSAQQLKELLSAVAVFAAGGRPALADYSRGKGDVVRLLSHQVGNR
ncbi:VWA domain-containing protein [Skermanella sp. TT6]|uniref:VWA domain-containing protein n=1 Tax=Skermanella cutis TaxID=2775420 RepID=A0ABX7BBI6_9PROT|nr:VWA domain-containing protein [Skermanella sp. TT6]QQP91100.1 VWA domain-containing protein [Skermanella sp. TT6]